MVRIWKWRERQLIITVMQWVHLPESRHATQQSTQHQRSTPLVNYLKQLVSPWTKEKSSHTILFRFGLRNLPGAPTFLHRRLSMNWKWYVHQYTPRGCEMATHVSIIIQEIPQPVCGLVFSTQSWTRSCVELVETWKTITRKYWQHLWKDIKRPSLPS